jgi:glycosyltransferase involved in cell wall biosynthesis
VAALSSVTRHRPAALYSSAPPWSGHVAALAVARATGLPWIADFRDPWARAPWRTKSQSGLVLRASALLERRVMARADAVLFATQTNRDEYVAHYGDTAARKSHVVLNGCDPQEFQRAGTPAPSDRFVLLHAGSLYGGRTPVPLFRAIAAAIRGGTIDPSRFRLRLIGMVGKEFTSAASSLGLDGVVEFLPRMPREAIVREMSMASCLLLLQPGTTMSIPGKLYEYLAVGRRILALVEPGETSHLVQQSGIGVVARPDDQPAIHEALKQIIARRDAPLEAVPIHLYDGDASASQAVSIIEQVSVGGRSRRSRANVALEAAGRFR